jgi:hypothetical protein
MNTFPLYDIIVNEIVKKKGIHPSDEVRKSVVKKINLMDKKSQSRVYLLIRKYQLEKSDNILTLPYHGNKDNKNVVFSIDKLPSNLIWILEKFIEKTESINL